MIAKEPTPHSRGGFVPLRERLFRRHLARALAGSTSILDVGCGTASPLGSVAWGGTAVGVDRSIEALRAARTRGIHRSLVLADALRAADTFRAGCVDTVVALDVIEHFERADAVDLIRSLERLARRRIVLLTPNGFVPQPASQENPWQEHRSGFTTADLEQLGYRVRGMYGLWLLLGPYGEARFRPGFVCRRLADLTAPLVYALPRTAFSLLAVKDVERAARA